MGPTRRQFARRIWLSLLTTLVVLTHGGCAALRGGDAPLQVVEFPDSGQYDTLIIFLPGIRDAAADFSRFGFVDAVRAQNLPVDMVAVDVHLGYYLANSFIDRLSQDVIHPARARGVTQIWLVGVSLGGMGSMLYADAHPVDIDGIVAIAPYLGSQHTLAAIEDAGGLHHWEPEPALPGDFRPGVWSWLKSYKVGDEAPTLLLAYGEDDRYAQAHRTVAALLPRDRVTRMPGGHDWATWRKLWEATLVDLRPLLHGGGEGAGERGVVAGGERAMVADGERAIVATAPAPALCAALGGASNSSTSRTPFGVPGRLATSAC